MTTFIQGLRAKEAIDCVIDGVQAYELNGKYYITEVGQPRRKVSRRQFFNLLKQDWEQRNA